jgi:hypothetical protein
MTPAQSRTLKPLARISWQGKTTDQGTILSNDWSGVEINWDDGHTSYNHHNNMGDITHTHIG